MRLLAEQGDLPLQVLSAAVDRLQPLHDCLQAGGPQAHFFGQRRHLAAAMVDRFDAGGAIGLGRRRILRGLVVREVLFLQPLERRQVMRHAAEHLLLEQSPGERDLDHPVERDLAALDLLERLDRRLHGVVALEERPAEAAASHFDRLGDRDFLRACQQRDLPHLREVDANRVVGRAGLLSERALGRGVWPGLHLAGLLGGVSTKISPSDSSSDASTAGAGANVGRAGAFFPLPRLVDDGAAAARVSSTISRPYSSRDSSRWSSFSGVTASSGRYSLTCVNVRCPWCSPSSMRARRVVSI